MTGAIAPLGRSENGVSVKGVSAGPEWDGGEGVWPGRSAFMAR